MTLCLRKHSHKCRCWIQCRSNYNESSKERENQPRFQWEYESRESSNVLPGTTWESKPTKMRVFVHKGFCTLYINYLRTLTKWHIYWNRRQLDVASSTTKSAHRKSKDLYKPAVTSCGLMKVQLTSKNLLTACVEKEKRKAYCLPSDTKTVTRAKQHNEGKENARPR